MLPMMPDMPLSNAYAGMMQRPQAPQMPPVRPVGPAPPPTNPQLMPWGGQPPMQAPMAGGSGQASIPAQPQVPAQPMQPAQQALGIPARGVPAYPGAPAEGAPPIQAGPQQGMNGYSGMMSSQMRRPMMQSY
jgi:hypothetical protein